MKHLTLYKLSIRLIFYWFVLSALGMTIAPQITSTLLPFFSDVLIGLSPDYSTMLQVTNQNGNSMVEIIAETRHAIKVTTNIYIPAGKSLTAYIHVLHVMVPIIILFTILCSWPTAQRSDWIKQLLLGIPVIIIILGITIPPLLEGHIEMQLTSLIQSSGGSRNKRLLLGWVVFVEMGGIWLLPIIGAILCRMAVKEINFLSGYFNGSIPPSKTIKKKTSKVKKKARHKYYSANYYSHIKPQLKKKPIIISNR